ISRDGLDLGLELTDSSASVRVAGWFADPPQVPDVSLLFALDPGISADRITQLALTQQGAELDDWLDAVDGFSNVLYGNGGRDILQGGSGDDVLDGGAGDDFLFGAQGDDLYLFGPGYGTDGVSEDEDDDGAGFDTVRFGVGVAPEEVSIERDFGDLLLSLNDGTDVFSIFAWFREPGGTVEQVEFDDGTVWDAAVLESMLAPAEEAAGDADTLLGLTGDDLLSGFGGDDEIYGFAGADQLEGGAGYDYLEGGKGDDSYFVSLGTEVDEIYEDEGYDRLAFGAGIAPEDLQLSSDEYSLFVAIGEDGDSVTIWDWLYDARNRVEEFQFADGTVWDEGEIWNRLLGVANQTPALVEPIADQSADEDASFSFTVAEGAFSDPDGDELAYTASLADGSELPAWLSFDAGTRTFSGTPAQADVGPIGVRVTATDGEGLSAGDEFTITVTNVNDAPVAAMPIPDLLATEDIPFAFSVPAESFADEDPSDVLAWYSAQADGSALPAWLSFDADNRTFSGTPDNDAVGAIDVRVTAADAGGLTAFQDFRLSVENVNDAPTVAVPIADQFFDAGSPFVFAVPAGTFADEDAGDSLVLSASLLGGGALPAWLSFDAPAGAFAGSPAATDIGIFHVQVTASDAAAASAISDFGLVIRAVAGSSVTGGKGDDLIYGGSGNETLTARGGNDYLFGDVGDDLLKGGAGNDALQGGEGDDVLRGGSGQNLLDGGAGNDVIFGGKGAGLIAGGAGNDTIRTGSGADVILFNRGDGVDTLISDRDSDNTLSFGGGIRYSDLSFSRDGKNLVVSTGGDDRVVLKNWYSGKRSVLNLQIVLDSSEDFDAGSGDPLYNKRVQAFDFLGLVSAFDAARTATPGLTSWALTNALLQFHLSGVDDMALGGDLAYWYGRNRSFAGISLAAAQEVIGAAGFGSDAQSLRPFSGLQEGFVKLG
ncbi:MAG: putative Ig domain-containing protein, partial [Betaproteobacteria bacterium]